MNKHIRRWAVVCGLGFAACSPFSGSAVAQVSPFYESTPTGRTDDNGRPELDRFGAPESSSAIGISIPIGGPSRDLTPGVDDEREPADPPTEVSGAFSLKGMVRGEDLEAALRSVLASASRGEETPLELYDPAYDRYVNMSSLGTAWRSQDPAALADGALQLLEGERILLRPHAKLPADKVLILAGKLATEKQDGATLERLKKAAELHGKKEAAAQLAASGKLGAAARGDEGMTISIGETTPEEYQVCSSYLARIRTAKIAGDAAGLKNLQTELASQTRLQPQRREQLLAQVQKIAAALPKDKAPDPALEALSKLAGNSRGWGINDVTDYVGDRAKTAERSVRTEAGRAAETVRKNNPANSGSYDNRRSDPLVHYTLYNSTNTVIRFRLESGRDYVLGPGQRAGYKNSPGSTIYVYNSGRSYSLRSGDHKFWMMNEGRIGLDLEG